MYKVLGSISGANTPNLNFSCSFHRGNIKHNTSFRLELKNQSLGLGREVRHYSEYDGESYLFPSFRIAAAKAGVVSYVLAFS